MLGDLAFMAMAHKTASETLAQQVSDLTAKIEAAKPKPKVPTPDAETPATNGEDAKAGPGNKPKRAGGPRLITDPELRAAEPH
jgi:hypothetical protein